MHSYFLLTLRQRRWRRIQYFQFTVGDGLDRPPERVKEVWELRRSRLPQIDPSHASRKRRKRRGPPLKFGIRLIQGQQKAAIQYRADAVEDQVSVIMSE